MKKILLSFLFLSFLAFGILYANDQDTVIQSDAGETEVKDELKETDSSDSDIAAGQELFTALCKACHSINTRLTGPPLTGVSSKRDKVWLYKFVKNSAEMIASGDADAVAIFKEYNQVPMLAFPQLTDQEIDQIFAYVDIESERLKAAGGQIKRPAENFPSYIPLSFNNPLGWSVIGLLNILMVFGLSLFIKSQKSI